MPIVQFEVSFEVEVLIGNQWFIKIEPTASLGHAIREAKKLLAQGFDIDHVRIVKTSLRREVIEVNLE